MSKFLLDSGSTSNILNFNTFKSMGFKDSDITKCGQIALKGSAGVKRDIFLGFIEKNLYIQSESGKYYSKKTSFLCPQRKL